MIHRKLILFLAILLCNSSVPYTSNNNIKLFVDADASPSSPPTRNTDENINILKKDKDKVKDSLSNSDPTIINKLYSKENPLTIQEISTLRVRDIKRRLARHHGYSSDELSRMLDKKELIETLAFEEHKESQKLEKEQNHERKKKGIITAIACVLVYMFWPLLTHVYEVAHVNFVVYTDRKYYEFSRCFAHKSTLAILGVFVITFIELLQFWLSASILLSWVIPRNKYLFPMPSLPIKPTALLNSVMSPQKPGQPQTARSPLDNYGINIAPMIISWIFRFGNTKVQYWVGKVLARALKRERKRQKKKEKEEAAEQEAREREIRKKERRQRRKERKEREMVAEAEAKAAKTKAPENPASQDISNSSAAGDISFDEATKDNGENETSRPNIIQSTTSGFDDLD